MITGSLLWVASLPNCPGVVLAICRASLDTTTERRKLWCAVLGLNQARHRPRSRGAVHLGGSRTISSSAAASGSVGALGTSYTSVWDIQTPRSANLRRLRVTWTLVDLAAPSCAKSGAAHSRPPDYQCRGSTRSAAGDAEPCKSARTERPAGNHMTTGAATPWAHFGHSYR